MAESNIEWTDATWNPVVGCSILSAGCTNCYAMRMAARLDAMGIKKYAGITRKSGGRSIWTGLIRPDETSLKLPLQWRRPRMIFVNSMSDLFHDDVPAEFIEKVWNTMEAASHHTFQILTKRPDRMRDLLMSGKFAALPNVWLGTSVEDANVLDRIDALKSAPAAIRFISFEPLIGSVAGVQLNGIHWVIVGGESGPRARQMRTEWVDEIQVACDRQSVAFFFKQWGGINKKAAGRTYRGRTWDALPELRM